MNHLARNLIAFSLSIPLYSHFIKEDEILLIVFLVLLQFFAGLNFTIFENGGIKNETFDDDNQRI